MNTIEAVIEPARYDVPLPWVVEEDFTDSYLRVHSGMTDEEIGLLMLTACLYNHADCLSNPPEILQAVISKDRILLPGGLRLSAGGQVKVVPGCCSGLEDWRDWLDVPHGNNYVWTGHDPAPEIEYTESGIRIWQDVKANGGEFIEFERHEFEGALIRVRQDLEGFVARLHRWANIVAPGFGKPLADCFSENLFLSPQKHKQ